MRSDIYAALHRTWAGNYLFPAVVIIILLHVADPISNTSHFHVQPVRAPPSPPHRRVQPGVKAAGLPGSTRGEEKKNGEEAREGKTGVGNSNGR